jgi:hypothetical protein
LSFLNWASCWSLFCWSYFVYTLFCNNFHLRRSIILLNWSLLIFLDKRWNFCFFSSLIIVLLLLNFITSSFLNYLLLLYILFIYRLLR